MRYLRLALYLTLIIVVGFALSCRPLVVYEVSDDDDDNSSSYNSIVDPIGDVDNDKVPNSTDVDDDNDGLIEISTLAELYNIRHNLSGDSYKESSTAIGQTAGQSTTEPDACDDGDIATTITLCGYELTNSLNFDFDGDGLAWSGSSNIEFAVDKGDTQSYFDGTNGWEPIGDSSTPFNAIFEGNNNVIHNLAIHRDGSDIGFFGLVSSESVIRNIAFNKVLVIQSDAAGADVGGVVGHLGDSNSDSAVIANVHVIGTSYIKSGSGADRIGGVVGNVHNGVVTSATSTASIQTDDGDDRTGGVAGYIGAGMIVASSADCPSTVPTNTTTLACNTTQLAGQ